MVFCTYLNISLLIFFYHRESQDLEIFLCKKYLNQNLFFINLDSMALFYNAVFTFELFLKFLIFPKQFLFSAWNMVSFMIISSSIASVYLEYVYENDYEFLKSTFLAFQLFRFCLIFKDILFLKKFFLTLKVILYKCAPIITLFVLVLFFFSLIGIY